MLEPTLEIARRIEGADGKVGRALVRSLKALYPREPAVFTEVGGGTCYVTGSPSAVAQVVGLGLDGRVDDGELDRLMEFLDSHRASARIQLSSLAEPTLLPRLLACGFRAIGSETVLAREIVPGDLQWTPPSGFTIQGLHPGRATQWARMMTLASAEEGEPWDAIELSLLARVAADGFIGFFVFAGGEIVAPGGFQCVGDVACLYGHATLERSRLRELQQAMILHSLAICAERGITLATFDARPDTTSMRNAERTGFTPLYPRTLLAKAAR